MVEQILSQMQDTGSLLLGLALNKWLILAVASCVFSFVVRLLLGPVRGQDIAGLSLAPVLAGVMVILIGQALFTKPAPGNNWALSWEWRIDQVLLLFTALGWVLGLLLDLMRRPMSLSLMFGLIAGLGYSIAFLMLLALVVLLSGCGIAGCCCLVRGGSRTHTQCPFQCPFSHSVQCPVPCAH